jgi:hypothetical protein
MNTIGRVARLALVCGIFMLTSGCVLDALFSLVVVSEGEGDGTTLVTLQASATARSCQELSGVSGSVSVHCAYVLESQEFGSTAELTSAFGILALIIDPLILQVPVAAHTFAGTFSGGSAGSLSITEVPGSLQADVDTAIAPQPGTKLVIVDFPDPAPPLDQSYGFTLSFHLPGNAAPVPLKALFAARVQSNGQTFFVPLLPCETDFANIPTITLPASGAFQSVSLPLTGVEGCAGRLFRLSDVAAAIPTLSTWVAILLALGMAGYGAYLLRVGYR